MSSSPEETIYFRIHSSAQGVKKPPVVLLHGLMGFSANWGKIWPQLEQERDVIVIDQRGHGRSYHPTTGYDPSDYAQDLRKILADLKIDRVHLVGHSMGGRVALRFASLYPERSISLTMEDSGTAASPSRVDWIRSLLSSIPTPFPDRESAKNHFAHAYARDLMTGSFLQMNLVTADDGSLNWRFFPPGMVETIQKGRALDAMEEFTSVTLPTLVIRGEKSVEFPSDEALKMCACRSNIRFALISGAGHFVHAEKPVEFCQQLKQFLGEVESANH